jgi:hypothetical protein
MAATSAVWLHRTSPCSLLSASDIRADIFMLGNIITLDSPHLTSYKWRCIQKFLNWPPGARTANGIALCHQVQLYHYFMSQSSEFCHHNRLCCFSMSVCCCCCLFYYRLLSGNFWIHPRMQLPANWLIRCPSSKFERDDLTKFPLQQKFSSLHNITG